MKNGGFRGPVAMTLLCATGCGTTASIYRADGSWVEGSIEGGGQEHITVSTKYGGYQDIPRSEIQDIDHPGNVHALVGGIVLAYGVANIAVGMEECQNRDQDQAAYCTGVFIPAAIGVGMLAWGLGTWLGSKGAADDTSAPPLAAKPAPKPVPVALPPAPAPPASAAPAPAPAPAPTPAPAAPTSTPPATAPPSDDWAPAPPKPAQ